MTKLGFSEYQEKARGTAIYPDLNKSLYYPVLGLCGEAGEVAEKTKKIMRDKGGTVSPEDRREMAKELGDVLWYLANTACEYGIDLGLVAQLNLEKLASRKERSKLKGNGDNR